MKLSSILLSHPRCLSAILVSLHLLAAGGETSAATITWNGAGADDNLLTAGNWVGGVAPAVSGDALVFGGALRLFPGLAANRSVASLTFAAGASAFDLTGAGIYTLTGSSGLVNNSTVTQTIENGILFGGNQTWGTNSGTIVLNGAIANGGYLLTASSATGTITLNGILSGTGGVTKSGSGGTLILNGANTYSGLTTLGAGTVQVGNNSAFGTGTLRFSSTALTLTAGGGDRTVANGYNIGASFLFTGSNSLTLSGSGSFSKGRTVQVGGAGVLTLSGPLAGNRILTKSGTGTLVLSGNNSSIASVTLTAGTLMVGQSTSLGTGTFLVAGGTVGATSAVSLANAVSFTGNASFTGASEITFGGATSISADRTLTTDGTATVNFNGVVSGAFSLVKSGDGVLLLGGSAANTYSGLTTVNSGRLILAKTSGNAFAGALTIGNGSGDAGTAAVQLNASNQIPDASAVTILSDGQLNLQSYSDTIGALTLTGGSVVGTGTLVLGGNVTFNGTGGSSSWISSGLSLLANRTFLVNSNGLTGADLTLSGPVGGSFSATKTGAGNLLLSGANTFSGGYFANAGGTLLGSSTALGSAAANLGDTTGTAAATLVFSTVSGVTVSNGITVRSGSTGTAALGGNNLSGVNTFSGPLTLNKSVIFNAAAAGEVSFTGTLSGIGGFTKTGGGTIRLGGTNTSTGAMLISEGILALGGNNTLGSGSLTVDAGTLDFGVSRTASSGAVILDNGGAITGSGTSTLTSSGNFDLRSGTVQVALAGTGSVTKSTAGSVTLSGSSAYTGLTTISAGSLVMGKTNALPTTTAVSLSSGASLDLQNFSTQVGSLTGGGSVLLGSGTLTAGGTNTNTTFSGVVSGTGGFTKSGTGTLTLSGANTFSGATTVNAGTLALGANQTLDSRTSVTLAGTTLNLGTFSQNVGGLAGSGSVILGGGKFGIGAAGASETFSGIISGAGTLVKNGAGTLTLTGTHTTTAAVEINAGTLTLSGASGSLAAVPSITITIPGALLLDNSGTNNSDRIGNSTAIRLGGGTLQFVTNAAGTTETLGTLSAISGSSNVIVTHNGGTTHASVLTFAGLGTLANGATVDFNSTGGVLGFSSTGPQIYLTGQANGLLGGWATVGADAAEYFNWGIRAFSSYYEGPDGINLNDATKIVRLSATSGASAGVLTLAGTVTDLGLNLTDYGNVDLGSDSSRTLNLANGSLIKSTAIASTIFGAGRLTAGGGAAGNLNVSVASGSMLTVNSVITNNAVATVGLAKGDLGTLVLGGANTFSGNVFLNGGVLQISAENNLGTGTKDLLFSGGTLQIATGFTTSSAKIFKLSSGLYGTFDVLASQTLTFADTAGLISTGDTASVLMKTGLGSVVVQNANTGFTGTLRLDQGSWEMRNATSLGSGNIQLAGGTLSLVRDTATTFGNNLTLSAASTLRVSRLTGTGNVVLTAGNLDLGSNTLTVTGDGSATLQLGAISLSGAGTLSPTTADLRVGVISGANALTKSGSGALILTAAGTYTGATAINAGTLRIGLAEAIPDASAVTLAAGSTLDLSGFGETIGALAGSGNVTLGTATLTTGGSGSTTFSGSLGGTGGLVKSGATTVFTLSGVNTYTGATTVSAGTLTMGGTNRLAATSALSVASGATFALNDFATTTASLVGGGTVSLGSGTLTTGAVSSAFSGIFTGSGGLVKSGAGTLTLSGNSLYTGSTAIQGGGVILTSAGALGAAAGSVSVSSGAMLALENNVSVGSKGLTLNGGATLFNNSGTNSWAGAVTLTGAATVTATFGSLTLTGASNLGASSLSINGAGTVTLSGSLSGTSSAASTAISKTNTGTLVLSGASTYSGVTTVGQGILQIGSSTALGAGGDGHGTVVASGATLRLQSPAGIVVGNEALTLEGTGVGGGGALWNAVGDNTWAGAITLFGNATVQVASGTTLGLNGSVGESSGPSALTKTGGGVVVIAGITYNTGPILVEAGTLRIGGTERLNDVSSITISSGAVLDLNDNLETLGSLSGAGTVNLGTVGDLTVGVNATTTTFSGTIVGIGSFSKAGAGTLTLSGANTYDGITTVNEGVLTITTIANGGVASSLGMSSNLAANLVLDGGTLRYTGPAQSTDRAYTLDIGGGTFDASGTGALTLAGTPVIAGLDLARGLTLTGTSTAANTLGGALSDSGTGKTSLTKAGTGVWVVTAGNTYTGTTAINAGILVVNGTQTGAGAVTVAAGATLQGTGTLAGATAVSGTHAPGSTGNGLQKFTSTLQYQSGSIFEWSLDTTTSGRGVAYDAVNVGGLLSGSDSLFKIVLSGSQSLTDTFWSQSRTWTDIFTNGTSAVGWTSIFNSRPIEVYNSTGKLTPVQGAFTLSSPSTLTWSAVPEPGNLTVAMLIGAGIFRRRRK